MIAPLLEGAAGWVPPASINLGVPVSHFGRRAVERGVVSVPGDVLQWAVERALVMGRDDLVADVFDIDAQSRLVRVLLPEGHFYPVIAPNGVAVTLYAQAQLSQVRAARRCRLRLTGKRLRVVS